VDNNWKNHKVTRRTLRCSFGPQLGRPQARGPEQTQKHRIAIEFRGSENAAVSRLRRLQVTGKTFFITCNLLPVRTPLVETDFEALGSAVVRVRLRREFFFTGYVFMPDHWHAIIIPKEGDVLPNLMDAVKVAATFSINRLRHAKGQLWQPRYFDRIVRNVREYHKTMEYMHLNPVRRGLIGKPGDWLWSSIHSHGGPGPIRLPVDQVVLPADENTPL
jgi:putative transposase